MTTKQKTDSAQSVELTGLLACYWPSKEPKVVEVLSGNDEFGYKVRVINTDIYGGADAAYLRPFDSAEFHKARHKWLAAELTRRAGWHRGEAH